MSRKSTGKRSKTEFRKLDAMRDTDIDYSDIPELPDDFAASAEWFMPTTKALLSLRLDADVVEWFKAQGSGYQSRMNAVLKAYMLQTGKQREVRDVRAKYLVGKESRKAKR